MEQAISAPRPQVSEYAPKVCTFKIDVDKIRDVIGTGGKTINQIILDCDNVKINIEDDGQVAIYHSSQAMVDKARAIIEDIVRVAKVGEVYHARVNEVRDSFAFVTLFTGTDALLHVSEIAWERTSNIKDVLHVGDMVDVKVTDIDDNGKVKVSMKVLLEKPEGFEEKKKSTKPSFSKESPNVEKRVFKKKEG